MPKIHLVEMNQVARLTVSIPTASLDESQPYLVQSITTKGLAKAYYDVNKQTWCFSDGCIERSKEEFVSGQVFWVVTNIDLDVFERQESTETAIHPLPQSANNPRPLPSK